jgi:hypothetical protein
VDGVRCKEVMTMLQRMFLVLAALVLWTGCGSKEPAQVAAVPKRGLVGAACVADTDCKSELCDRTVPGGYCSRPCETNADCGLGAVCDGASEGGLGVCFQACKSQRECRSRDFQCYVLEGEQGVCSLDVAHVAPQSPNVGAPCSATISCAAPLGLDAFCVPEVSASGKATGYRGGMCVATGCTDAASCGDGLVCVIGGAQPFCAAGCDGADDCRTGYDCDETTRACLPTKR